MRTCGCGTRPIQMSYRCDKGFCPTCSKRRQKRLRKRFLPLLKHYKNNHAYKWRFLTLSPENYKTYEEGKKDIRKIWLKFVRRSYIKERVKGGFYVIEVTKHKDLWNFHIHAIIYSRYLDNNVRGHCKHCGQNHLKFNRQEQKFYCANRNCNKIYEGEIKDSRISREFKESSGRNCMTDISQARSPKTILNYLVKYISQNKESFSNLEDFAYHIIHSYKEKQINAFREFYDYNKKIKTYNLETPLICPHCKQPIRYSYDPEVSMLLMEKKDKPPPDYREILIKK